jgi:hypothetical protein
MIIKTIQGIPFLLDSTTNTLYAYEKVPTQPLLSLGTYDPAKDTFTLLNSWKEQYEPRVAAYRASLQPRSRLPTAQPAAK